MFFFFDDFFFSCAFFVMTIWTIEKMKRHSFCILLLDFVASLFSILFVFGSWRVPEVLFDDSVLSCVFVMMTRLTDIRQRGLDDWKKFHLYSIGFLLTRFPYSALFCVRSIY